MQVAAIGFCMGGALAVAASQYRKICAAVACYGLPPADLCMVSSACTSQLQEYYFSL